MLLSAFLEATSIHGLRYLSESKSILIKSVWFIVILTSFSAAAFICYNNVVQWQNSPILISQARPAHVKVSLRFEKNHEHGCVYVCYKLQPLWFQDLKIPMPTVTICPQKHNFRNLIENFYNKYYEASSRSPIDAKIVFDALYNKIESRWSLERFEIEQRKFDPFKECRNATSVASTTNKCDFVRLLHEIVLAEVPLRTGGKL